MKIGETVEWSSQSQGITKHKVGIIIGIVPLGKKPSVRKCGNSRDHESYVIHVKGSKNGPYWPMVSKLKVLREGDK